jgi:hypothetical protein
MLVVEVKLQRSDHVWFRGCTKRDSERGAVCAGRVSERGGAVRTGRVSERAGRIRRAEHGVRARRDC